MLLETRGFEFGEFRYDPCEKVLFKAGQPLSITPKTLKLLQILIEKRGHVVEKSELMELIWGDSFVEEVNIAFTVNLLRKALGDSARNSRFIETIPTRGYRFIAEVREVFENDSDRLPEPMRPKKVPMSERFVIRIAVGCVFLIGLISVGSWYARSEITSPLLSSAFSVEKLSTSGDVNHAVISPDGKNVVYVNGTGSEKESIWVRDIKSSKTTEIVPVSDDLYGGLEVSPDGSTLYFARVVRNGASQFDIYRTSLAGSEPEKIVDQAQGWLSVSPDGLKISFVRCDHRADENCSLWIADASGKNERKLDSRPSPFRIGVNKFSPDGRSIAFAVGQSENRANEFGLVELDLADGTERELTKEKFYNITGLAWLPDRSGILLTTRKSTEANSRVWLASLMTEDISPLTKDSETYTHLSLDKAADRLVSAQVKVDFHISLLNTVKPTDDRMLADAVHVAFAPNGKLLFTSAMTGHDQIWSMNADGTDRRQLTNELTGIGNPIASHDGNSIYYMSNHTGEAQVWRMNSDGSAQTQLTQKEGGFPLFASPDGKWVYYHNGKDRTLWRVSPDGRNEEVVIAAGRFSFAISPDGTRVAYPDKKYNQLGSLLVASLADGRIINTFRPTIENGHLSQLAWTPDGKDLAYILRDCQDQNNRLWFQPVGRQSPRQIADLGTEDVYEQSGFAFSPDGKTFVVVRGGWKEDAVLLMGLK